MPKKKRKTFTVKQKLFLKLYEQAVNDIVVNGGDGDKTLKAIMLKAGYAEKTTLNPKHVTDSKAIKPYLSEILTKYQSKRKIFLDNLTDKKVKQLNAKDMVFSLDKLQKHINLLTGESTANINQKVLMLDANTIKNSV